MRVGKIDNTKLALVWKVKDLIETINKRMKNSTNPTSEKLKELKDVLQRILALIDKDFAQTEEGLAKSLEEGIKRGFEAMHGSSSGQDYSFFSRLTTQYHNEGRRLGNVLTSQMNFGERGMEEFMIQQLSTLMTEGINEVAEELKENPNHHKNLDIYPLVQQFSEKWRELKYKEEERILFLLAALNDDSISVVNKAQLMLLELSGCGGFIKNLKNFEESSEYETINYYMVVVKKILRKIKDFLNKDEGTEEQDKEEFFSRILKNLNLSKEDVLVESNSTCTNN